VAARRRNRGGSQLLRINPPTRPDVRKLLVALSFFLVALAQTNARAHAFLDHADPAAGSTVNSAPRELTLTFTQNLEPAFSSVEVTDANGARVDQGKPQISGNVMRVDLKALSAGSYQVQWHALSIDTHKTQGSFSFQVSN
jgi:copper resistance protein C